MMIELVMYSRTSGCPFVSIAKRVLAEHGVPYREVFIDQDAIAKERVLDWVGFMSVPTMVVTEPGGLLPIEEPAYLEPGTSPRGIDRGSMLTEPNVDQLVAWLTRFGLVG